MYFEKIVNVTTGDVTLREYSPEEIAEVEQAQKEAELIVAKNEKIKLVRADLLDKLGITEEEAKLLLG